MSEENLFKEAVSILSIYIPVDVNDPKELMLLHRAIQYADIHNYCDKPKDIYEGINKEVFFVKATCYFKRKKLNPFNKEDIARIKEIQGYEYFNVSSLKAKIVAPLQLPSSEK